MSAADIILEVEQNGGRIRAAADYLELNAPAPLLNALMAKIRAHKQEILAALQDHRDYATATGDRVPDEPVTHRGGKTLLSRLLIDVCHGLPITPAEIYKALGAEDFEDVRTGRIPVGDLRAFAKVRLERQGMERGNVPQGWTEVASCAGCGPVWLWTPGMFAACPWCFVRRQGLLVPRPPVFHEPQVQRAAL